MKVAIMQPYLYPYIGYFQLINSVDKFVIYDDVNYIKQGWINRNSILVQNKPLLFTLPLQNPSSFLKINETFVNDKVYTIWVNKFLKTIEQSYKKAPYFAIVYEIINQLFDFCDSKKSISELNYCILCSICEYLGITTELVKSSSIYENSHLKAQERLIDICLLENISTYINPIGGIALYDKTSFKSNGINLFFLKSNPIVYDQSYNEFIPWLSIIDVLMFNSIGEINSMLNNYELL
jgi:hypothetical protein